MEEMMTKRMGHRKVQHPNGQSKKKVVTARDISKEKLVQIERAFTQVTNSSGDQQKGVSQEENSKKRILPMKETMVDDNSKSKDVLVIEDVESMTRQQCVAPKDTKKTLGSMSIDQFLKENESVEDEEENIQNRSDEEEQNVGEVDAYQDKDGELNEQEGTNKKRTRGPTQCLAIHGRSIQERLEVVLDMDGEPIGPTDKIVTDLSYFLGTIARNSNFCPLIYTSFKALLKDKDNKAHIWTYVQEKFNISDQGEKAVFTRINDDAWRRYKSFIKKTHFSKYSTMKDRLKNCPLFISEAHFKQLLKYWSTSTIQHSKKEVGEKVTQVEMFITTCQRRKGRKGKEMDEETHDAIIKLQGSIQNSSELHNKHFNHSLEKKSSGDYVVMEEL